VNGNLPRNWLRDLRTGIRFAVGGGREGWARNLLVAVGVGLGVSLLLVAAAVPGMLHDRALRGAARDHSWTRRIDRPGPRTLLTEQADTTFRDDSVTGVLLDPEGPGAPVPPGLGELPAAGDMVVSPALARLLAAPGDGLLRERFPYRVTGTIGKQGLSGPGELFYYAGSRTPAADGDRAIRIDHFGADGESEAWSPILVLLVVVVFVVLLVPVAVFVGTATRFGGERRDRRMAAVRLVGADSGMTRRIAAGEALFGSLIGLVLGTGFFVLARQLIGQVTLFDISVFPSDVMPAPALAALVVVAVPACAVAVTLLALRGAVIEPLGVVRSATPRRRRLWWRLALPAIGLLLLYPLIGTVGMHGTVNKTQVAAGAVLLLVGLTAVLPWLVEAVVRLPGGAGSMPGQLAFRRLQLTPGSAARMVSGITVAVAGAIAVQTLFSGVQSDFTSSTGQQPDRAQVMADVPLRDGSLARQVTDAFRTTPGVRSQTAFTEASATTVGAVAAARARAAAKHDPDAASDVPWIPVSVADCADLRAIARISGCEPGSVYVVPPPGSMDSEPRLRPGETVDLNTPVDTGRSGGPARLWRIPATARTGSQGQDASGTPRFGILATPQALDPDLLTAPSDDVMIDLDMKVPDAVDHVRNTGMRVDPTDPTMVLRASDESGRFGAVRRGLLIGAVAVLLMIGASLLVSMLEQLRDRRRLLAVLVAFGTRRGTLALSVLWQTAVPVVLGLALAVVGGLGLGAVLLRLTGERIRVDWPDVAAMAGAGGGVVLLVTVLSLPPLWRMMRPDGLRTE
jgi:hypothetical protein